MLLPKDSTAVLVDLPHISFEDFSSLVIADEQAVDAIERNLSEHHTIVAIGEVSDEGVRRQECGVCAGLFPADGSEPEDSRLGCWYRRGFRPCSFCGVLVVPCSEEIGRRGRETLTIRLAVELLSLMDIHVRKSSCKLRYSKGQLSHQLLHMIFHMTYDLP